MQVFDAVISHTDIYVPLQKCHHHIKNSNNNNNNNDEKHKNTVACGIKVETESSMKKLNLHHAAMADDVSCSD